MERGRIPSPPACWSRQDLPGLLDRKNPPRRSGSKRLAARLRRPGASLSALSGQGASRDPISAALLAAKNARVRSSSPRRSPNFFELVLDYEKSGQLAARAGKFRPIFRFLAAKAGGSSTRERKPKNSAPRQGEASLRRRFCALRRRSRAHRDRSRAAPPGRKNFTAAPRHHRQQGVGASSHSDRSHK